ncbi:MAG TPA: peptide-methionine (S)-S-oxide reductase, partial [Burkholderiaceae bacterium]|nr:peptide-methionine (S)-S-oxide reductase [Burkholderiaceae bacterium]
IFCQSPQQEETARRVMREVEDEGGIKVVTRLLGAEPFWPAENDHRDYYARNPNQGYCQVVISPKLAKFRKQFASLLNV